MKEKRFVCKQESDMLALGGRLASLLTPPAFVALHGGLGAGKTALVRGMGQRLGVDAVSSPTFTIVQEYEEGRVPFYHFDVYRIADPEEMYEIGFDEYMEGEGVCFIEWANLIDELLPEERTEITIEKDLSKGFDYRLITRKEIR